MNELHDEREKLKSLSLKYFLLKIFKYFKIAISSEGVIFALTYRFLVVDFNLFAEFQLPFHYERSKKDCDYCFDY